MQGFQIKRTELIQINDSSVLDVRIMLYISQLLCGGPAFTETKTFKNNFDFHFIWLTFRVSLHWRRYRSEVCINIPNISHHWLQTSSIHLFKFNWFCGFWCGHRSTHLKIIKWCSEFIEWYRLIHRIECARIAPMALLCFEGSVKNNNRIVFTFPCTRLLFGSSQGISFCFLIWFSASIQS